MLRAKHGLTITQAAQAFNVSRSTIRRHRESGSFPNNFKDQNGFWRIPKHDLFSVFDVPTSPRVGSNPEMAVQQTSTGLRVTLRDGSSKVIKAHELAFESGFIHLRDEHQKLVLLVNESQVISIERISK